MTLEQFIAECELCIEAGVVMEQAPKLLAIIRVFAEALEFYAQVFPMPMEVRAEKAEDKKFEAICTQLLSAFHNKAREAQSAVEGIVNG